LLLSIDVVGIASVVVVVMGRTDDADGTLVGPDLIGDDVIVDGCRFRELLGVDGGSGGIDDDDSIRVVVGRVTSGVTVPDAIVDFVISIHFRLLLLGETIDSGDNCVLEHTFSLPMLPTIVLFML
jgi:hypothetical protein